MSRAFRDRRLVWRGAAAHKAGLWMEYACLAAGTAVGAVCIQFLPVPQGNLVKARELGIVSWTILAGYPKSADSLAFYAGVGIAVCTAVGLWLAWAAWLGRRAGAPRLKRKSSEKTASSPVHWSELWLLPPVLMLLFFPIDDAVNRFYSSWHFLSEEGEMLAWIDAVLRGDVLYRDVFCLYGPLSVLPPAILLKILGPSILLYRLWVYALGALSLIPVYWTLRQLTRTRSASLIGGVLCALFFVWQIPGMSWSNMRVGLGLGALACLTGFLRRDRLPWLGAAGALLGVSLFYSQEVGIAACLVSAAVLSLVHAQRGHSLRKGIRRVGALALGFICVAAPIFIYFLWNGGLTAMLYSLFIYPSYVMLGFGGLPYPPLLPSLQTFLAAPSGRHTLDLLEASRFYTIPFLYAGAGLNLVLRALRRPLEPRLIGRAALLLFGLLLFRSALGRSGIERLIYSAPPALILLVCLAEDAIFALLAKRRPAAQRWAAGAFLCFALVFTASFSRLLGVQARSFLKQVGLTLTGRLTRPAPAGFGRLGTGRAGGIRIPADLADSLERTVAYLRENTRPEEPVWAFPNEAMLNFLADRPSASPYVLGLFALTREMRRAMVSALDRSRPPYAVHYTEAYPVDRIPHRTAMREQWDYLERHYKLDRRFGPFLVMRRKEAP